MATSTPQVVLHIGAMKTGTTYLQNLIHANKDVLCGSGWAVPGQPRVVRAVREVMGLTDAGKQAADATPHWDELTTRIRAQRGDAGHGTLMSMEFLSYAQLPRARQVVAGLHDVDLHVVLTVRDAGGALPSQWQSLSRNGGVTSWPDFAREVRSAGRSRPSPAVKAFRRTQDVPRMLEVWSQVVAPDRLSVITVPPATEPRSLLWERFLSVLGVDAQTTSTEDAAFGNPRLGYGSCDLLRRLNAAGLADERPSAYRRVVRHVARNHLLPLRDVESQPRLDERTAEFAASLNARTTSLVATRATLVGDPGDLTTASASLDPGDLPRQVPDEEVRRAADAALAGATAYCEEAGIAVPPQPLAPAGTSSLPATVERLCSLMRAAIAGTG